jgi:tetratricopeptide (TPR) repeat protein
MQSSAPLKAWTPTQEPLRPTAARLPGRLVAIPLALALSSVLQGCASVPPVAEQPVEKQARPGTAITRQIQAEFDSALTLLKAEQYEKSIDAFKKLAAALPDNPIPLTNLALAYKKLGQSELAEEHLKQALVIEPENPVASNELALLYRQKGRFTEARPIYEKVLGKYPHFNMAHKNLGVLCDLYLKDYECALTHYKIYSLTAPDDKAVQIWIADLQKRTGK